MPSRSERKEKQHRMESSSVERWHKLTVTDSSGPEGPFRSLCREFQRCFIAAGAPEEMALFTRSDRAGDAHDVYLSPGSFPHADELVRQYGGQPCAPPYPGSVTMVYGVPGADRRVLSDNHHHHALTNSGEHTHILR